MDSNQVIQGRYKLTKLLGQGSFAKVHLAVDIRSNTEVAIKVIERQFIFSNNLKGHIMREIEIMKRVRHPNIVHLLDVLASKNNVYLVMEYVSGGELFDRIKAGILSEETARRYFQQLITAVDFCHVRGVFHRDLKPQNLLINAENEDLKVTDFGLSVIVEQRRNDLLQDFVGTPAFMAPEVIKRKGYDGAKIDIWSCGIILFMMMAGHVPFKGKNREDVYDKVCKGDFLCPAWLSQDFILFVKGILCVDPDKRMTIADIMKHPWFKVGYRPRKFYVEKDKIHYYQDEDSEDKDEKYIAGQDDEDESGYESDSSLASTLPSRQQSRMSSINAFDIISFSSGFNLSGFFEDTGEQRRFLSSRSLDKIVAELQLIAKVVSFKTRTKDSLMILQGIKEGPKGPLIIAIEISQLTSNMLVLQVKKKAGDLVEYNEFLDKVLKPRLRYLIESPLVTPHSRKPEIQMGKYKSPAKPHRSPFPAQKSSAMLQKPPLPTPHRTSSSGIKSSQLFSPKHKISPGHRTPGRRSSSSSMNFY